MKFISKEEFLKQPKEIQDKIKELWNPEQWDIYARKNTKGFPFMIWKCEDGMILPRHSNIWVEIDNNIIPLLTMDKIIEMIERVTDLHLEIMINAGSGDLNINLYKNKYDFNPAMVFDKCDNNMLHALWETLIEITKENFIKNY